MRLLEVLAEFKDQSAITEGEKGEAQSKPQDHESSIPSCKVETEAEVKASNCIDETTTSNETNIIDSSSDSKIAATQEITQNGLLEEKSTEDTSDNTATPKTETVEKEENSQPLENNTVNAKNEFDQSSQISKDYIPVLDNLSTPVQLESNIKTTDSIISKGSVMSNEMQVQEPTQNNKEEKQIPNSNSESDTSKQSRKSKKRKKSTHNNPCDSTSAVNGFDEMKKELDKVNVVPDSNLNDTSLNLPVDTPVVKSDVDNLNNIKGATIGDKHSNIENKTLPPSSDLKSAVVPPTKINSRADRRFHRGSPRKYRRPAPQPSPLQSGELEPLCGMVFVARRFTAQVLYHLLNAVRHVVPDLNSISPQYTASLGEDGEVRDLEKEHRKQEEVLKR